jgi:uncharacterized surface protein with fasciclin (FAS1) repeats/predicted small secreted protein
MNRTVRLLSLLIAALLVLAGCTTAEEAGEEATEDGGAVVTSPSPAPALPSPPETEPSVDMTETEAAPETGVSADTIFDLAAENPQLSQLVTAIEAAGLRDALEQTGPITVFAPNNSAFASMSQSQLTDLLSDPQALGGTLQHHVVEGSYPTSDLSDGQSLTTLEGSDLPVSVQGDTVTVGGAEIVQADLRAGNGVVHIIDGVLEP